MNFLLLAVCGYLLGSVPFAYLIAKAGGVDLRRVGSGNIGATNLSRAMGRKWGYVCFVLDVGKGLVPMGAAAFMLREQPGTGELFASLGVGVAAVLGHVFPVFLGFRGGKGVATSFGIALGFWPWYTICAGVALMVWVIFVLIWRYISLASIAAAIAFPVALVSAIWIVEGWQFWTLWPLLTAAVVIPVMVVIRHRSNIGRIVRGTESKVFMKLKEPAQSE